MTSTIPPSLAAATPIESQWAGYVLAYPHWADSAAGRVDIPRVTCVGPTEEMYLWVGYDGVSWLSGNTDVEQDGLEILCPGPQAQPVFQLFWELASRTEAGSAPLPQPIGPRLSGISGDRLDLAVSHYPATQNPSQDLIHFSLALYHGSKEVGHWQHTQPQPASYDATFSSSECILERPYGALPRFAPTTFSYCDAVTDSREPTDLTATEIPWNGALAAVPGPLNYSTDGFTVWPGEPPGTATSVEAWGYQMGDQPSPLPVPSGTVQVIGANDTLYALNRNGKVYWDRLTLCYNCVPPGFTKVAGVPPIASLGGGPGSVLALTTTGSVWTFTPGTLPDYRPGKLVVQVPGITSAAEVAGGVGDGYALLENGQVMAWGAGGVGQLGDGSTSAGITNVAPQLVPGLSDVISIAGSYEAAFAVEANGTVWGWGCNGSGGGLGNGDDYFHTSPVQVLGVTDAVQVVAAGFTMYALTKSGQVWAWGAGGYGQLGTGTVVDEQPNSQGLLPVSTPELVPDLSGVTQMATTEETGVYDFPSDEHDNGPASTVFALTSTGQLYSWGYGLDGAIGNGGYSDETTPTAVPGLANLSSIAGGDGVGLAITAG